MKSVKKLLCGLAVLLAASCAKEETVAPTDGCAVTQITASWGDERSKTVLGEDGTSVLWSPNEQISVFYNGDGLLFRSINTVPKATTLFVSSGTVMIASSENNSTTPYLYGIYPYSEDNAQQDEKVTLTVPAVQAAVEGSFARGAFPSIGRSRDTNIAFYNVCGGVCFTLCQSGIRKIILTGGNDEVLAGRVKVQFDQNGKPFVCEVVEGETNVTLTAPDGGEFETDKWYFMSVLPVSFGEDGFMLEFIRNADESEYGVRKVAGEKQIKRSTFGSMEHVDSDVEFGEGIGSLSISPEEVLLVPEATVELTLAIRPEDAGYEWLKWSSSDQAIATVDKNGEVTGLKDGKCTITVTSDNGKTASCEVYVSKTPVTTGEAGDIGYSSATLCGSYNITGAESAGKDMFFLYSDTETTLDGLKSNGTKASAYLSGTSFASSINSLTIGTQYCFVAVLTIFDQTVYGEVKSFTTDSSAFTLLTQYGRYTATDTADPVPSFTYVEKRDQMGAGTNPYKRYFNIINLDEGTAHCFTVGSNSFTTGNSYSVSYGEAGGNEEYSFMKLVYMTSERLWFEDQTNHVGYIIGME